MEIQIDNRQNKVQLDEDIIPLIENAIKAVLELEGKPLDYEVSISFVDNEEIRELNRLYRNVDKETDVLSFPMEEGEDNYSMNMLGDIVISLEKALEQSIEYNHSLTREIIYLTVHSMFHLLGYDHMNDEDRLIMRNREKEVMKSLKIFKNERDNS
ncbi:MAG TPA: rRNA maturation RNase YbeY [Tissierellia bacterium]|nr:rRNA maturation RNase YbeY [Tissierellia bacterium]